MSPVFKRRLKLCGNESALWELQRQLAAIWNERDRLVARVAELEGSR
jgi:hypothetical protein